MTRSSTRLGWTTGNLKLKKTRAAWERRFGSHTSFVGFNLPQLRSKSGQTTCPFAGVCAEVCYAAQGTFNFSRVQTMYEHNFAEVRRARKKLIDILIRDLDALNATHVRLHDSGDFFAPWYYKVWLKVADVLPSLAFYGYTKSLPIMDFEQHPANFKFVQSMGGKRDDLIDYDRPHSRIFPTGLERRAAGYVNGNLDDLPVLIQDLKIGLVYHGVKILSSEELISLRTV